MARPTCSILDYNHMKNTIMKVFRNPSGTEKCFYGNGKNKQGKSFAKLKFGQGHKEDVKYKSEKAFQRKDNDQNPTDQEGNVLKCFGSDSTCHLAFKCPYRSSRRKSSGCNEVHITLFA